jgi:hypothetical protein
MRRTDRNHYSYVLLWIAVSDRSNSSAEIQRVRGQLEPLHANVMLGIVDRRFPGHVAVRLFGKARESLVVKELRSMEYKIVHREVRTEVRAGATSIHTEIVGAAGHKRRIRAKPNLQKHGAQPWHEGHKP